MNIEKVEELIRNHISEIRQRKIELQVLSGLTNVNYSVIVDGQPEFVFKEFAPGFDRAKESKIIKLLSQHNIGSRKIFQGNNYSIQEFLKETKHPSHDEMQNKQFLKRTMQTLAKFHSIKFEQEHDTLNQSELLFSQKQSAQLAQLSNKIQQDYESKASTRQEMELVDVILEVDKIPCNEVGKKEDQLNDKQVQKDKRYQLSIRLLNQIEKVMEKRLQWRAKLLRGERVGLCHNDLHSLNILYNQKVIHCIDYDYIGNNYIQYDLANFINELTLRYTDEQPGYVNTHRLTIQDIKNIVELYPHYHQGFQIGILGFLCACNLFWAIWSLKFELMKKSGVFDYAEYGIMRMQLFWHYAGLLQQHL